MNFPLSAPVRQPHFGARTFRVVRRVVALGLAISCLVVAALLTSGKTNLCQAIRLTQGAGMMPDGTSRFSIGGERLFHYMGTSTFAQHTVVPETGCVKIREDMPLDKACLIGCGVMTGIGAVLNTAQVEPGSTRAVLSAAPTPVVTPHPIRAARSRGMSSRIFTRAFSGTSICSA